MLSQYTFHRFRDCRHYEAVGERFTTLQPGQHLNVNMSHPDLILLSIEPLDKELLACIKATAKMNRLFAAIYHQARMKRKKMEANLRRMEGQLDNGRVDSVSAEVDEMGKKLDAYRRYEETAKYAKADFRKELLKAKSLADINKLAAWAERAYDLQLTVVLWYELEEE